MARKIIGIKVCYYLIKIFFTFLKINSIIILYKGIYTCIR